MNPFFKDEFHAIILPVTHDERRPYWSVLIPTYNCANYLEKTIQSVLEQDPGPEKMEIIVVDDHSTKDNPESVVKRIGKGRIRFIRQEKNVGKVRNYETGLKASRGIFIHQLHGDDKVRKGFYNELEALIKKEPHAKAFFTRTIYIDKDGRWTGMTGILQNEEGIISNFTKQIYLNQMIQTPSIVVKREVYESLGGFDRRLVCMEDWEMWLRISNFYPVACSNKVLAEYRTHSGNATYLTIKDGTVLKTHKLILSIIDNYIQPDIKTKHQNKRNLVQSRALLHSFKIYKNDLNQKQRWQYIKYILKLKPSILNLIRLVL